MNNDEWMQAAGDEEPEKKTNKPWLADFENNDDFAEDKPGRTMKDLKAFSDEYGDDVLEFFAPATYEMLKYFESMPDDKKASMSKARIIAGIMPALANDGFFTVKSPAGKMLKLAGKTKALEKVVEAINKHPYLKYAGINATDLGFIVPNTSRMATAIGKDIYEGSYSNTLEAMKPSNLTADPVAGVLGAGFGAGYTKVNKDAASVLGNLGISALNALQRRSIQAASRKFHEEEPLPERSEDMPIEPEKSKVVPKKIETKKKTKPTFKDSLKRIDSLIENVGKNSDEHLKNLNRKGFDSTYYEGILWNEGVKPKR